MSRRVLVVENDIALRTDLVEVLEEEGFQVDQAGNGREALDLLKRSAALPAVILIDLRTPVMTGRDLVCALGGDQALSAIPVVVMSGEPNIEKIASSMGAASWLQKPFGMESLLAALASAERREHGG